MTPPSQQKTVLRYSGAFEPKRDFGGTDRQAGIHQESLLLSMPLWRGEKDGLSLTARAQSLDVFPDQTGLSSLYDLQLGLTYAHQIGEKRLWSLNASFGSASDKPFRDSSVDTVNATAFYAFPGGEKSSWAILLNYSNNRPILNNLPLPGFAYTYAPSKEFRGTFGAPFASVFWQFADAWSVNLYTVVPWVIKATVSYSIWGPVQAFGGFDFSQATYLMYGRSDPQERLFFDEKRFFAALKSPLSRNFLAELEAGYAFDRSFFSARRYTTSPASSTDLGACWYGRWAATFVF